VHKQGKTSLPRSPQTRRLCILIADPSVDTADALGAVCEAAGHDVDFAYDEASALESARRLKPDVVFIDASLAGVERQLRADPGFASTSIEVLSGPIAPERVLELLQK